MASLQSWLPECLGSLCPRSLRAPSSRRLSACRPLKAVEPIHAEIEQGRARCCARRMNSPCGGVGIHSSSLNDPTAAAAIDALVVDNRSVFVRLCCHVSSYENSSYQGILFCSVQDTLVFTSLMFEKTLSLNIHQSSQPTLLLRRQTTSACFQDVSARSANQKLHRRTSKRLWTQVHLRASGSWLKMRSRRFHWRR